MRRGLRSSTKKEAQAQIELEEKERVRERSVNLQKVIDENNEALEKEIRELLSEQSSSEEHSDTEDTEKSDVDESARVESPKEQFVSESSLVWDEQGDLQSPLKDTSDLLDTSFQFSANQDSLPPALSRGRSVSECE